MEQKKFHLKVKCPYCGVEDEVIINRNEILSSESGILRIPIEHEEPEPHMIIIDIDATGFIRGTYLIKKYVPIQKIPVLDAISVIGPEKFARILGWGLLTKNLYIYGDDPELVDWTRKIIAYASDGDIKTDDENGTRIYLFNPPLPDFSVNLLKSNIESALKRIKENKAMAAFLRHEIKKYLRYLDTLAEIVKSAKKKLSLKDLTKATNQELSPVEIKFLLMILMTKGTDVAKKVKISEVKIVELF